MTIHRHESALGIQPEGHREGTDHHCFAARPFVSEQKSWNGHDNQKSILDGRRCQCSALTEASLLEDPDNVVDHGIDT